jgi:NPCBM/NEW2 domain
VWILIAALITSTAAGADVTAKKLDGATLVGTLASWQDGQVVMSTPGGLQRVAEVDLLFLERSTPANSNTDDDIRKPIVELVDGTVVPLTNFSITGSQATVVPRYDAGNASADVQPVSVQVKKVMSVRLQPMSAAVEKQWEDVCASATSADSTTPSDLLVVLKHGGQTLDYVEGVIGQVTERDIEFSHDGNTVHVSRDKVAGLIFYRANTSSDEAPRCVLRGANELRIRAANNIRLVGNDLQLTTLSGVSLRWPWAEVTSADYSAGKLVFLSGLTPVSQSWQPLIALPTIATHASALGQPRIDRASVSGSLSLWYPDGDQSPGSGHTESFAKGLALRSRTEIVYRLPRGFSRFSAVAGIEPATRSTGDVMLSILGDDRSLLERAVTGSDAPLPIELNVDGVKQLKIIVDYGKNFDTGDWLNLCNARIVK